jgi:mannose-6-phosphate isomerase-like protein (cupin superfamily)
MRLRREIGAAFGFYCGRFWRNAPSPASMDIRSLDAAAPFITKDGSEIRELLAHRNSVIRNQSLAEARVPVGGSTQEHYHIKTEEIYFITAGHGRMRIETEVAEVKPGDAIAIPPGKKHKIWNTGSETLKLLCCCSPAYEHGDTIITEGNEK